MAYSSANIINLIRSQLNDPNGSIWNDGLICNFVTEAQNQIVAIRPDAGAVTSTLSLTQTAKQAIPADGERLLDVVFNTGGSPVQKIKREQLTELVPGWTTETGTEIEFYMFDEENPKVFWVYPTPESALSVELIYSQAPDEFTTSSNDIGVPAIYIAAVYEWVLYRCLSMNSKRSDTTRAQTHLQAFYNAISAKTQSDNILMQVQG